MESEIAAATNVDSSETPTRKEKSTPGGQAPIKNLNLRLTLANYNRFHDFRRKLGLSGNEPTLVALLDLAEKNRDRNVDNEPAGSLDRLDQTTRRLEELLLQFENSKPVRKIVKRTLKPAGHPGPIRRDLTWRREGKEWFPGD